MNWNMTNLQLHATNGIPIELNDTILNSTGSLFSLFSYSLYSQMLTQVSGMCFRRLGASRPAQKCFSTFLSESSKHFTIFDAWE